MKFSKVRLTKDNSSYLYSKKITTLVYSHVMGRNPFRGKDDKPNKKRWERPVLLFGPESMFIWIKKSSSELKEYNLVVFI